MCTCLCVCVRVCAGVCMCVRARVRVCVCARFLLHRDVYLFICHTLVQLRAGHSYSLGSGD